MSLLTSIKFPESKFLGSTVVEFMFVKTLNSGAHRTSYP